MNQKQKKVELTKNTFSSVNALNEGRELTLNAFSSVMFSKKATQRKRCPRMLGSCPWDFSRIFKVFDHKRLKISARKQILQRSSVAVAQVQAANTSENLLTGIRQIIYFLYRTKEITKKVYKNMMNSVKL